MTMRKKFIPVLKFVVLLIVAGVLLFFAFRGINIRSIFKELLKAKPIWLIISVFISFIALISRAYRWKLLIEPLGYHPTLKNTTYSVMVGYFANLAFPRLGEVTRCGSLNTSEDIPFNKLLGTVIIERAIDVISLLICMTLVAIIEANRMGNFLKMNLVKPVMDKLKSVTSSGTGIFILVSILIILIFLALIFVRYSKRKSKLKRIDLLAGFIKGLASIKDLNKPWLFVFHSIFIWVLYYLSVYVCLFALPFTSHLGLAAALFLLVAGGFGMSAPVQGGIGAYHLLVSQGLMLYGLSRENGLTFATLVHSLQLIMVVVTGSLALFLLFLQKKRKQNAVTE